MPTQTHPDLPPMAKEAIEEYLAVARYCITAKKENQGVYGYPAVLLLLSLVDAFSNYAGYPEHSFLVLRDIFPNLISKDGAKKVGKWFRHPPAHHAIIMPGTKLSADDGDAAIEMNAIGEPTHIRLKPFCEAVEEYWRGLESEAVKPTFISEAAPRKMEIYGSVSAPTVTGAYLTSTLTLKPKTK
jgi:hypothetical protein